jgi:hypothetical protein
MWAALWYAIGIYWRSIMEKTALLTERLPRDEVEIKGVGTVTVRGLSRYELLLAGKGQNDDVAAMERRMLSMALVDPEMSEDDVAAWQKCSPAGEIMPIVNKINELSGVGREAQKEAYKSLRDES